MVQLVERLLAKEKVVGPNPIARSLIADCWLKIDDRFRNLQSSICNQQLFSRRRGQVAEANALFAQGLQNHKCSDDHG